MFVSKCWSIGFVGSISQCGLVVCNTAVFGINLTPSRYRTSTANTDTLQPIKAVYAQDCSDGMNHHRFAISEHI